MRPGGCVALLHHILWAGSVGVAHNLKRAKHGQGTEARLARDNLLKMTYDRHQHAPSSLPAYNNATYLRTHSPP